MDTERLEDDLELLQQLEQRLRAEPDIEALLGPPHCTRLTRDLRRFLIAKKRNIEAAFVKASNYYRWTIREKPELIGVNDIGVELDSGKLLYMCEDKENRPVFLVRASLHFPPAHTAGFPRASTEKLLAAVIRYAVSKMKPGCETFSLVADMEGFGFANQDTGVLALASFLSKYFPGRLHRVYIVNPPYIMWAFWRVIRPFVTKPWLKVLQFLSCGNHLLEFIEEKHLPTIYGGQQIVNLDEWKRDTKTAVLASQYINLHTLCCHLNDEEGGRHEVQTAQVRTTKWK